MEGVNFNSKLIRRDRIYKVAKGWFFATREGIDMGPFPDQSSAELEMLIYARSMGRFSMVNR